jgi:hypothetical protein
MIGRRADAGAPPIVGVRTEPTLNALERPLKPKHPHCRHPGCRPCTTEYGISPDRIANIVAFGIDQFRKIGIGATKPLQLGYPKDKEPPPNSDVPMIGGRC